MDSRHLSHYFNDDFHYRKVLSKFPKTLQERNNQNANRVTSSDLLSLFSNKRFKNNSNKTVSSTALEIHTEYSIDKTQIFFSATDTSYTFRRMRARKAAFPSHLQNGHFSINMCPLSNQMVVRTAKSLPILVST